MLRTESFEFPPSSFQLIRQQNAHDRKLHNKF